MMQVVPTYSIRKLLRWLLQLGQIKNKEWQGALKLPCPFNFPFKPIFSTAHPVFDPYKSEMFVVNYGRSLDNLLESAPFIKIIDN
jgi:hypothetical protein